MPIGLLHGLCRYMTQGTGALLYQGLLFTRNTGGYLIVAYPLPRDNGINRLASILRCISEPDTGCNHPAISVFLSVTGFCLRISFLR